MYEKIIATKLSFGVTVTYKRKKKNPPATQRQICSRDKYCLFKVTNRSSKDKKRTGFHSNSLETDYYVYRKDDNGLRYCKLSQCKIKKMNQVQKDEGE